jgi:Tfp pilus assembly protein PilX
MKCSLAHQCMGERGIALALALFALVVIGALVSGSFFAGRLEQQSGQNSMFAAQALAAAEAGLEESLVHADPAALEALAIGGAALDLGPLASQNAVGQVNRLTSALFLVRCTGSRRDADGHPLATRSLGLVVRILPADGGTPARLSAIAERAWVQLF